MKVGIYTHYLDIYPTSAPSLYQMKLIENLGNFKNIEIILIHHYKNSNLEIYKEFEEAIISKFPYFREKDINSLHLDIIHFNSIPWYLKMPLLNNITCKKIATVHGDIHWVEPELGYNKITEFFRRFEEPKMAKLLDNLIAVSNSLKSSLVKYLKYPEQRIKVIYGGIDHSIFYPRTHEEIEVIKAKYEIDDPYILHVSAYSKRKNPNVLFRSFKLIKNEISEIKLVIVGKGWPEEYEDKLNYYRLNKEDIKFLGWVDEKDLPVLYTGATVFFSPSYHETFGFPSLEAMACGTPVVSSNRYAIPEIVGKAAILHDPNDYKSFANSIIRLLTNENMRKNLIKKGLRQAKKFSWERTAKETYYVYKGVVNNGQ